MEQTLLLRVVLSSTEARRLQLTHIPETVADLIDVIKRRFDLQEDFSLQFEDPDFGNSLCNLTTMSELPAERAVLHILWQCDVSSPNRSSCSSSSADTISVHSDMFRPSYTDSIQLNMRQVTKWPSPFPVPKFSYDVELKLRKGNDVYEKTKKGLDITRDIKMEILDKIAEAIFEIKSYPERDELESVAAALVLKYPCLKEPGSVFGYEGWTTSIRYKLGNYRSKLRQAGCNEVDVNSRKRGGNNDGPFTLKKPRRGEVNHVPDHPQHHDSSSLEEERVLLAEEMKKKRQDTTLIRSKMNLTFSLRRKEVVEGQPMVSEVLERWPALFTFQQISEEFHRITGKNLLDTFMESLNKYGPHLLRLYRAKREARGKKMADLLDSLDEQTSDITFHRNTATLRGLPIYVRDDATSFFLSCSATEPEERVISGVPVAILTVFEDEGVPNVLNTAIVLEGAIVLQDIPDISAAFAYLFGLLYAINIDYPRKMMYTFEAIQTIFFQLGSKCSQRTRSLKTKLLA